MTPTLKELLAKATRKHMHFLSAQETVTGVVMSHAELALHNRLSPDVMTAVLEGLEQISEGSGAFNRDPLKHAENVIEGNKATALRMIALLNGNNETLKR